MLPCVIHTGQWSYFWLDSFHWKFQTSFHRRFRVAKSSLRLAYLLRVDGLFLSCILVGRVALVSKEKVKVATMVTKILNTLPWLDSVWQRSGTTLTELFCPFLADWMPHHGRLFIYIVQWLDLIEKSGRAQSNWKSKFTALTPGGTKPLFVRLLITIVHCPSTFFLQMAHLNFFTATHTKASNWVGIANFANMLCSNVLAHG